MHCFFLLGFILFSGSLSAETIYVKAGSHGNGTSWSKALPTLQLALQKAKAGDQIWVAAGTYQPTSGTDRTASFHLPDGVEVYGGFAGYERQAALRDWNRNPTILTGEIGAPGLGDNAYTVVTTLGVSSSTVLDGFTITGGNANGMGKEGDAMRCGGGWFNDASNGQSNPTIRNCKFIGNRAYDGAGMYNYARNGVCKPTIDNCRFLDNKAELDGGAIFNNGSHGKCTPLIARSLFQKNQATYGAGILNKGDNGETTSVIRDCIFSANTSYVRGSAVYNDRKGTGVCDSLMQGCRFQQNLASIGEEVSSNENNTAEALGNIAKSKNQNTQPAPANSSSISFRSGF